MPQNRVQLTDSKIRNLKPQDKDYKVFDGGGLFLLVKRTNKKYWRVKYRFQGKERQFAIGVYPNVTLKNARKQLHEIKEQLDAGIDPTQARQESKQQIERIQNSSFEIVAQEWFNTKVIDKSASHRKRSQGYLKRELIPFIGTKQIHDITAVDILDILRNIEARGVISTAHRIKQVCSLIFRYGIATGRLTSDPTIHLSGALKPHRHKHFAALTKPADVAELMHALNHYQGGFIVQNALKLSPLLICRPGELRNLEWSAIY